MRTDELPGEDDLGRVLVGRTREVARLCDGLRDALAGHAGFFLLTGEPGIGKTRLAEELGGAATRAGAQVLWGRCWEGGGAPPYWPWVEPIRAYARSNRPQTLLQMMGDEAAEIAQMVPELRDLLPGLDPSRTDDGESARTRLFESVATFLKHGSEKQPLILVLDDLHVADHDSLRLLQYVVRTVVAARIMTLATYRDADVQRSEIAPLFAELETVGQRIALAGLSEVDVGEFLHQALGRLGMTAAPSSDFVRAIRDATGGNPFFLDGVVSALSAEGRLDPETLEHAGRRPPEHVREVVRQRLRRLSPSTLAVLEAASVIGREFDGRVMERLLPASGFSHLEGQLEEAISSGLLSPVRKAVGDTSAASGAGLPGDRYRFVHSLVAEALAEPLAPSRRAGLHLAVGRAMEDVYGPQIEDHLSELAYHFVRGALAGDADKAVTYAMRAAEHATAMLAFAEGVRHYRQAREVSELCRQAVAADRRAALLLALAAALDLAGDFGEGDQVFLEAAAAARNCGDRELLARAALGAGGSMALDIARRNKDASADGRYARLLEEALQAIDDTASVLRARLLARLAEALCSVPHSLTRRSGLCDAAVELARQTGDPRTLHACLVKRQFVAWSAVNLEQRLSDSAEALRVAETIDSDDPLLNALAWRIPNLIEATHTEEARALTGVFAKRAHARRRTVHVWNAVAIDAMWALFDGDLDQAADRIEAAHAAGQLLDHREVNEHFYGQMWMLAWERDRMAEIGPATVAAIEKARASQAAVPLTLLAMGDRERAQRVFTVLANDDFSEALSDDSGTPYAGAMRLFNASLLAEVCPRLGNAHSAQTLYDVLLPAAHHAIIAGCTPVLCVGAGARLLGQLAAMIGRWPEAEERFNEALVLNTRMRTRLWLGHTQCAYARALLARNDAAGRVQADSLLGAALATARELQLPRLEREATTAANSIG